MIHNRIESEYRDRDLFLRYKMGIIIWSPLECGILTGKYIDDIPVILKYFLLIFK
jgi:aryl-alcohol dehydrogenase-like predicted oxidoreductase